MGGDERAMEGVKVGEDGIGGWRTVLRRPLRTLQPPVELSASPAPGPWLPIPPAASEAASSALDCTDGPRREWPDFSPPSLQTTAPTPSAAAPALPASRRWTPAVRVSPLHPPLLSHSPLPSPSPLSPLAYPPPPFEPTSLAAAELSPAVHSARSDTPPPAKATPTTPQIDSAATPASSTRDTGSRPASRSRRCASLIGSFSTSGPTTSSFLSIIPTKPSFLSTPFDHCLLCSRVLFSCRYVRFCDHVPNSEMLDRCTTNLGHVSNAKAQRQPCMRGCLFHNPTLHSSYTVPRLYFALPNSVPSLAITSFFRVLARHCGSVWP